jgi:hypothetical protein
MHFVKIEFFRRGHADQKREMRCEKYDDGDNGTSRSRNFGNRS